MLPQVSMKVNVELIVDGHIILTHNSLSSQFLNLLQQELTTGGPITPVTSLYAVFYYNGTPVQSIPLTISLINENGTSLELVAVGQDNSNAQYQFNQIDIVAYSGGNQLYTIATVSASGSKSGSLYIDWSFTSNVNVNTPSEIASDVESVCGQWCSQNKELCLHSTGGSSYQNALQLCEQQLLSGYTGQESIIQYIIDLLVIPVSAYPQNSPFQDIFSSNSNPYDLQGIAYIELTNTTSPLSVIKVQPNAPTLLTALYNYGIAFYQINTIPYALVDSFSLNLPTNTYTGITVKYNITSS